MNLLQTEKWLKNENEIGLFRSKKYQIQYFKNGICQYEMIKQIKHTDEDNNFGELALSENV